MNKNIQWFVIIIALILSISSIIMVLNRPKIGVVDNIVLIGNFSEAIAVRKKLENEKQIWKNNLKTIEDSVKAVVDILNTDYNKSSTKKKKELEDRLMHWNKEYSRYSKAIESMGYTREKELLEPIAQKVNSFIKNWAKDHGYDIVVGTGQGGVILSLDPSADITNEVLKDMNEIYKGQPISLNDKSLEQKKHEVIDSSK